MKDDSIIILPLPAGIERMQSAIVQFGENNLPGVFFSNDIALRGAITIKDAARRSRQNQPLDDMHLLLLDLIAHLLMACATTEKEESR